MQIVATLNHYKYEVFKWRYEATLLKKLALAIGMACLTGLVAQIRVPTPWSPVPVTGQTFAVLLAGVLLGRWWGGISQLFYAGFGALGLPWFAGWTGGAGVLLGPTGGYIMGFILAALLIGHFTDRYIRARSFLTMFGVMLVANFTLIHIIGLVQLGMWLYFVKREVPALWQLLWMGSIPFIAGDVTKAAVAAGIARLITPKKSYNKEVDRGRKFWKIP